jgi:glycosyltransferase involved in cell wall biosynthesis
MSQKRILYLSRGGSIGGSQRQLLYLIQNLDRRIYKPYVICLKGGKFANILQQLQIDNLFYPLHPWRKFKSALHRYYDADKLIRYARQNQISIIHSSDLWLSPYMLRVARGLNIPSVLHVRTPICPKDVYKHKCHYADKIIAISARVVRNLAEAGITLDKIAQIDDGVDNELFKPRDNGNKLARDLKMSKDLIIGIVGRISESKRQLDFIKAAKLVANSCSTRMRFLVIGPYYSESYYRKLRKYVNSNGLVDKVFFTGHHDDMPQVLSSMDILVSLSGGSVMFEAMACGTPVISAGFTSPKDSVHIQNEKTGLLVPSHSTSDLAGAMIRLIEDKLLRKMIARRARNWAVCNLSHHEMVQKTSRVYAQLLKKNSG